MSDDALIEDLESQVVRLQEANDRLERLVRTALIGFRSDAAHAMWKNEARQYWLDRPWSVTPSAEMEMAHKAELNALEQRWAALLDDARKQHDALAAYLWPSGRVGETNQ